MRIMLSGMKFLSKLSYLKLCRCEKRYLSILFTSECKQNVYRTCYFNKNHSRIFCTEKKNTLLNAEKNVQQKLEHVIAQNKVIFRETEQKIRKTGSNIIHDIKVTKDKVRIRMEEVIEVI